VLEPEHATVGAASMPATPKKSSVATDSFSRSGKKGLLGGRNLFPAQTACSSPYHVLSDSFVKVGLLTLPQFCKARVARNNCRLMR